MNANKISILFLLSKAKKNIKGKLGYALSVDEEYFMLLQTYSEIKIAHKQLLTQQKSLI